MALLSDDEWSQWSDREIARQCKVDHKTVARYREEIVPVTGEIPSETVEPRTYTTKHGTTAMRDTARPILPLSGVMWHRIVFFD